jgi:hypothetical protein
MGPRAGLDDVEKTKFLILPGLELRPLSRPARSQSLCRPRYHYPVHDIFCTLPYLLKNKVLYVSFEVFTAVTMKNAVFWDVIPCRSCVKRRLPRGSFSLPPSLPVLIYLGVFDW